MAGTIGVVGGLGPEGTVHYYRKLTAQLAAIPLEEGRPGVVVDHVWMERFAPLLRRAAEPEIASLLGGSAARLGRAGADVAVIAAVTPHRFLGSIQRNAPIPIVDLVEATGREMRAAGHRVVGLLGTRVTLTEPFFRGRLERAGIRVAVPDEADISLLDEMIFGPLASGTKTEGMRRDLERMVRELTSSARPEAIVVGCTDLMDLLEPTVPLVDPIDCHLRLAIATVCSK